MAYQTGESGFDLPNQPKFAVGMCRGLRAFGLTSDGILTGITYPQPWVDGQNRAMCFVGFPPSYIPDKKVPIYSGFVQGQWGEYAPPEGPPVNINEDNHSLKGCSCGFWSYWGLASTHTSPTRATGIIEGYGRVVIGSKGYRCSLANIRALYVPSDEAIEKSLKGYHESIVDSVLMGFGNLPTNYPSTKFFHNFDEMLWEYPPDKYV